MEAGLGLEPKDLLLLPGLWPRVPGVEVWGPAREGAGAVLDLLSL